MAEPKKRLTSTRSGKRRSHLAVKAASLSVCPQCKSPKATHQVCAKCGFYNGKDVLGLEKKQQEKEARRKARQEENNE